MMDRETVQKNLDFYSKNKLEKLVHLFGFSIRIYHDARSSECQTPFWRILIWRKSSVFRVL